MEEAISEPDVRVRKMKFSMVGLWAHCSCLLTDEC
jgi:hypothetical protein